jgi:hypothetical protein
MTMKYNKICAVGGIPIINEFISKKYPREIRLEAAAFVEQMYCIDSHVTDVC